MNSKTKKRMTVVAGIIVIVVIAMFAFVGAGTGAKVATVGEVAAGAFADKKVEVSGTVVDNSYSIDEQGVLRFRIADAEDDSQLDVVYDKGVSATFGNGVTAICTGRMGQDGALACTELVTKCPSKYESGASAIGVDELMSYQANQGNMVGKTVKVAGIVESLSPATEEIRLVLLGEIAANAKASGAVLDAAVPTELQVVYLAALSDEVKDGATVVITGSLENEFGRFLATDVALEA